MTKRRFLIVLGLGLVLLALAGYIILRSVSRQEVVEPLPTLIVETSWPGAGAHVIAGDIAGPIEKEVQGLEGMLHMRSQSANDGSYKLIITLKRGTDLEEVESLLKSRLDRSLPNLPDEVKSVGFRIDKDLPVPYLIATLSTVNGRQDQVALSNYANLKIGGESARLPGVAQVRLIGQTSPFRMWVDRKSLADYQLPADDIFQGRGGRKDVVGEIIGNLEEHLGEQAEKAKAGELPWTQFAQPRTVEDLLVKTTPDGKAIRLKEVARLEPGAEQEGFATRGGIPVVAFVLTRFPGERSRNLEAEVQTLLKQLRPELPEGMAFEIFGDFTPGAGEADLLGIDVDLPNGSMARTREVAGRLDALLRNVAGVENVLALSENPFGIWHPPSGRAFLLVRLAPAGKDRPDHASIVQSIRTEFGRVPEATLRLRYLTGLDALPRGDYPVRLAVRPSANGVELKELEKTAATFVRKLKERSTLTDVHSSFRVDQPGVVSDIDRERAAHLGVSLSEVFATILTRLEAPYLVDFHQSGRSWQVSVKAAGRDPPTAKDFQESSVRNAKGEMVPLKDVVRFRESSGVPSVIEHLDREIMTEITANLAPGRSLAEARDLCEETARTTLPAGFRLTWLSKMPPAQKSR